MNTGHWELFIDDHIVARSTGFDRIVHHPRPIGVVLPADKPWETAGVGLGHVKHLADGTFVAFGRASWWDLDKAATEVDGFHGDRAHDVFARQAYFESEDGIHWRKPHLGLVEAPSSVDCLRHAPYPAVQGMSLENNLGVPFVVVADLAQYGNVSDSNKRYALRLAPEKNGEAVGVGASWRHAPRGYFAAEIPDFLNDPNWRNQLMDSGGEFSPRRNLVHFWDDVNEEWTAMDQGVIGHWLPSRDVARFASKDLIHWTSDSVLYPDSSDSHLPQCYDEPMSLTPFCAEGIVFGLLSWFHSDRTHPYGGPQLDSSPNHARIWPYARKGTNEMRITVSRDGGRTWDRTSSREPWIPHGTEQHSYDRLVIGAVPPIAIADEDWFYVSVNDGDHLTTLNNSEQGPYVRNRLRRSQTALYIQKHNRYVSLTARNQKEVLISKPVTVSGSSLELNLDASRGRVRVGLAAADPIMTFGDTPSTAAHLFYSESGRLNNFLEGFSFDACEPVLDDSVRHAVKFKDRGVEQLRNRNVIVLLEVIDSDVYGFRFS